MLPGARHRRRRVGFEAVELDAPAGATLLLYTDGLVESRARDVWTGIEMLRERLAAAATQLAGPDQPSPLEAICDDMLAVLAPGDRDGELNDSLRTVSLVNAGGGRAVIHFVAYRIQTSPTGSGIAVIPSAWVSWATAIESLASLGLNWDDDYFLLHLGSGAAVPMTNVSREGMELLALGSKALERISVLDIRIQVIDALGDIYERDLQCIRPVSVPAPARAV
ncbi:SpoIIE family protein phosphatase [Streptomyces sp. NPDC094144]|uniref:SpoIIE family protein phosphatase n=1 Tax=Streptomyces sp. NPDC094144 TaxID=3366056 RepID=UPI0038283AD1